MGNENADRFIVDDRRRRMLLGAAALLAFAPQRALSQTLVRRKSVVGVLFNGSEKQLKERVKSIQSGVKLAGAHVLHARFGDRDRDRIEKLALELVDRGVDVIYAPGSSVAVAARRAIVARKAESRTALVFVASDPIGLGLVSNFFKPDGFATGVASAGTSISAKRLELLVELLRKNSPAVAGPAAGKPARPATGSPVRAGGTPPVVAPPSPPDQRMPLPTGLGPIHVGVLHNPASPNAGPFAQALRDAAKELGAEVDFSECRTTKDYVTAAKAALAVNGRIAAFYVAGTQAGGEERLAIARSLRATTKPYVFSTGDPKDDGGLLAYTAADDELDARALECVAAVLRGSSPASIPLRIPYKYVLSLNLAAAARYGLDIPHSLLLLADEPQPRDVFSK